MEEAESMQVSHLFIFGFFVINRIVQKKPKKNLYFISQNIGI